MRTPASLQGRLLALVLGLVVCAWLGTAVLTWIDARHELDELLDGHLAQAAALLVAQQAREIEHDGEDGDATLDAPELHRYAPRVAFQVFHEGRLALRSANAMATPMVPVDGRFREGLRTVRVGDADWRVFATHGAEHDIQVYVGELVEARDDILRAVLRSTLWPMAVALPLLALALWWAVRRGVAPLRRLDEQLAARRPDALQPVVLDHAPSEMVPMLDALNALFGRIGTLMASERRFTADAAHELRTPIAAIRAQAQVALAEPDAALRRHALRATIEGCDRATRLVEQLLMLSRLEAGTATAAGVVDLGALARRVVGELAPAALARGQQLGLDAVDGARIAADETLLAVLLRNLVDNALRYSPDGARIEVRVGVDGDRVRLQVDDSGPGLPEADRRRLGERFFRVLGSGRSGSGLGWSIVQRIAAVQGARVAVSASGLGGLAVDVDWARTSLSATSPPSA